VLHSELSLTGYPLDLSKSTNQFKSSFIVMLISGQSARELRDARLCQGQIKPLTEPIRNGR
jgi:hypothetical protein